MGDLTFGPTMRASFNSVGPPSVTAGAGGNLTHGGRLDIVARGAAATVTVTAAGELSVSGSVSGNGRTTSRSGSTTLEACRLQLLPGARLRSSLSGTGAIDDVLIAHGQMTLAAGSSLSTALGGNTLRYRDAAWRRSSTAASAESLDPHHSSARAGRGSDASHQLLDGDRTIAVDRAGGRRDAEGAADRIFELEIGGDTVAVAVAGTEAGIERERPGLVADVAGVAAEEDSRGSCRQQRRSHVAWSGGHVEERLRAGRGAVGDPRGAMIVKGAGLFPLGHDEIHTPADSQAIVHARVARRREQRNRGDDLGSLRASIARPYQDVAAGVGGSSKCRVAVSRRWSRGVAVSLCVVHLR